MENFGKFMAILMMLIISPLISGFVILKLYKWFVMSSFDVPTLSIWQVVGLTIMINFIRTKRDTRDDIDFWGEFTKNIIYLLLASGFTLFTGWIVQIFI